MKTFPINPDAVFIKTFDNYEEARSYYNAWGGWLLHTGHKTCDDPNDHFTVTDDEGFVKDLRGEDFIYHCEACEDWDELKICFGPQHLNEKGQKHVEASLKEIGLNWNLDATCTEIEEKILSMNEPLEVFNDHFYYEISRKELNQCGVETNWPTEIEITSDMVTFGRIYP